MIVVNLLRLDIMARWVRSSNRETLRRIARAPLFAWGGLVAASTPEAQREKAERSAEGIAAINSPEAHARWYQKADGYRALVAAVATPAEMAAANLGESWIKHMPAMVADHWWGEARKRGLVPLHPAIVAADALAAALERPAAPPLVQLDLLGLSAARPPPRAL